MKEKVIEVTHWQPCYPQKYAEKFELSGNRDNIDISTRTFWAEMRAYNKLLKPTTPPARS